MSSEGYDEAAKAVGVRISGGIGEVGGSRVVVEFGRNERSLYKLGMTMGLGC
jgi:hypothetical protein